MLQNIKKYWLQLQSRERLILGLGSLFVVVFLFYTFIWHPWHRAINNMQKSVQSDRIDLVWMRQQADLVKNGGAVSKNNIKNSDQSLLSVIEKTASSSNVRDAIQQMIPKKDTSQVSVVLQAVSFNRWLKWIDVLSNQYGVEISQLTVERDDDAPDIAEVRVVFGRN